MANLKTYLKYYKNNLFTEYAFNEVDNILFAELSYLNWTDIVPENEQKISLQEAGNKLIEKEKSKKHSKFLQNILDHLKEMKDGERYKNCELANFVQILNQKEQFGAICIYFEPKKVYVSFQGTDDSIAGWKEDFEMSYHFPILSQTDAINYLNRVITWKDTFVYVGGHSKGGNLAMCSAMYSKDYIKNKIQKIFNNDGPGFRDKEFNSPEYKEIVSKIISFKPEDSIVGILLNNTGKCQFVKTKEKNVKQHDLTTWECFGTYLEKGTQTENSKKIDKRIAEWLNQYEDSERENLILTFFNILEKINVVSVDDFRHIELTQVMNAINEMKNLDANTRKLYVEAMKGLLKSNKNG